MDDLYLATSKKVMVSCGDAHTLYLVGEGSATRVYGSGLSSSGQLALAQSDYNLITEIVALSDSAIV